MNERLLSFCGGGFCCGGYRLVGIDAKAELYGLLSELTDSMHRHSLSCQQDLQSRRCEIHRPLAKAPPADLLAESYLCFRLYVRRTGLQTLSEGIANGAAVVLSLR